LGLFYGVCGTLLFFLTFFTDHDYAWHNFNVIFANPLFLVLVPFGIIFAASKIEKRRNLSEKILKAIWSYVFIGALITIILRVTNIYHEDNLATLVLMMPTAAILSFLPDIKSAKKIA
jgi:thiamine transporter ThiT